MAVLTDDEFEDLDNHVRKGLSKPPEIVNRFVNVDGSYARLLRGINKKPVSIAKDTRQFSFDEPLYIRRIEVFARDTDKVFKGLELKIINASGETKVLKGLAAETKKADGSSEIYAQYIVKDFCAKVIVRSTLPYRHLKLSRVVVVGYSLDQLESIADKLARAIDTLNSVEAYVAKKKDAVEEALGKNSEATARAAELEISIEELGAEQTELQTKVEAARQEERIETDKLNKVKASLQVAEGGLLTTRNNDAQLKEQIASLNKDIAQKTQELQTLVSDRNLISDEYRDYVAEGKQQSKYYVVLLSLPLLVIGFCSWQLYVGARNILQSQVINLEHLAALSLQRIPFAVAIALVVTVCWKLASALIRRVMLIHGQRLTLAKLLVIAKDTVYSSSVGLDLSDEEKLRHRMYLKLDMLKRHLRSELDGDFEYEAPASTAQTDNLKNEEGDKDE